MLQVIKFYATWCGPCKQLNVILEKIKEEYRDLEIKNYDVDKNQEEAQKYNVMSLPTLIFLVDGEEKKRLVGLVPENQILKNIYEFITK